ncbi:MAG: PKD domain-containing protein [Chitinophagaceae bacterium]|nr:PKD domain-containing protein [Chitinophagaceae bacterium]
MKKIFILIPILSTLLLPVQRIFAQQAQVFPPVEYIQNQGQWDAPFEYKGVTARGDIYLRKNGFTILMADRDNHEKLENVHHGRTKEVQSLKYHAYQMNFLNALPNPVLKASKFQKHYYNYFLGNNPSNWKSKIHPAHNVDYTELYPHVDAHIYSESANVKYDLILHPGANVQDIQIEYKGIDGIRIDNKKLVIKTSLGEQVEMAPYAYQFIQGERKEVTCNYQLKDQKVSFDITGTYDPNADLYIDPVLVFCSFTGSTADNWGFTATYDSVGNFIAGGITSGVGYPTTTGAFQVSYGGGTTTSGSLFACDATFSKFNSAGNTLIYATYLGGSDNDQPHSIIVDKNDNLCISGRTYSTNFPVSVGCYDNSHNGGADMFITKLNSTGTALIGSTFIGGVGDDGVNEEAQEFLAGTLKHNYADDARSEIIFDASHNVYIASCTKSPNFPTTSNAFQTSISGLQDGVVFEFNDNLSTLVWSTYVGGASNDAAYVLTINKTNPAELFVGGGTISSDFPTTPGTLNTAYQGGIADGFLMKFSTVTKALQASTFIGTNQYDQVYGVQTDDSNNVYFTGQTLGAYPVLGNVYTNTGSSQFVSKINTNLTTMLLSTVYGSGTTAFTNISPNAFLVDKCGSIYVSGWGGNLGFPISSSTTGMPVSTNALQPLTDGNDFYFIVFSKNLQNLLYGSFFGQNGGVSEHVDGGTSRFDANGVIYQAICAACGASQVFPTTAGSYATQNLSTNCNLAALKIDFQLQNPDAVAGAQGSTIGCAPFTVAFVNTSASATTYLWNFGDGSPTTTQVSPSHTYTTAGNYTVTLVASNPNGCTSSTDTTTLLIVVKTDSINAAFTFAKVDSCGPFTASFVNTSTYNNGAPPASSTFQWDFGDGTSFTGANPGLHSYPSAATYTVTLTMTDTNACNSPSVFTQVIDYSTTLVAAAFDMPDSVCLPALLSFIDQSTNATTWAWTFGDGNTSNLANPTNNYLSAGTYTIFLVSGNPSTCNKFDTASRVLTVFTSPVADFDWSPNPPQPNTPVVLTNLSTGATKYFWDFGDGTNSTNKDETHVYDKDGYYNVCLTATNEFGCKDTTCKQVRGIVIPLVDVPSGFSPNGDGVNDVVYVKGYGIEKMTFRIFNRWGEKIFETTDRYTGWDGRYKGVMQEMEVYGYTLSVTFFDGTNAFKKGNITLLK